MFKFAFLIGVAGEWLYGPTVLSLHQAGSSAVRTVLLMLAAWMLLESVRTLWRVAAALPSRR